MTSTRMTPLRLKRMIRMERRYNHDIPDLYIPGMAHEVQLSESADRIPNMGDRLEIDAVRLDKSSRNLLETTPACHCFEKNAETERQSLAEYLAESVVTVTGRRWSYGDGHTYCTLDVEVRN